MKSSSTIWIHIFSPSYEFKNSKFPEIDKKTNPTKLQMITSALENKNDYFMILWKTGKN